MRVTFSRLAVVWTGLLAGNLIYQALTGHNDWARAAEISFFHGWAFLSLWMTLRIND